MYGSEIMAIIKGIKKSIETSTGQTFDHWDFLDPVINTAKETVTVVMLPWKDISSRAEGKAPELRESKTVTLSFAQFGLSAGMVEILRAGARTAILSNENFDGGEIESIEA